MWSQRCFSETIDTKRSAGFFDLLACFRMVCENFANSFPFSHIHTSSGTFEISREHHDDECRHEFCCSAKNGLEISLICKASRNMSLSVEVSRVAGVFLNWGSGIDFGSCLARIPFFFFRAYHTGLPSSELNQANRFIAVSVAVETCLAFRCITAPGSLACNKHCILESSFPRWQSRKT